MSYSPLKKLFVFLLLTAGPLFADEGKGEFTLSPANAPDTLLEAEGTAAGSAISLGHTSGEAKQKWNLIAKGDNLFELRPATGTTLVLTIKDGVTVSGTPIILAPETGAATQLWSFARNENGSLGLIPQVAPKMGLDDLGGKHDPGALIDIYDHNPDDPHGQWTLVAVDGATLPASAVPPPAGKVENFTFENSVIFPGTKRTGSVFIPAQYDGSKPACVYIQQDGYNPKAKLVLEELIASGEMPVTIGVFVRPGEVATPQPGQAVRRNRSYEYDCISDNYARFVLEELLPYVAKTYNLKLSSSGNDRCIVGASSGGIAAFAAAWHRPDAFSRVYACSGSFSAFRSGNTFPTMIRKFEAKPIRVYFTTGTHDMENASGDWFLLDQEIDKAMKFSGYDYSFNILDGGHCVGYLDRLPDAMRFLWKGWPAPVTAGPSAPRIRDIIVGGAGWQPAGDGYRDARSPACNSKGEVFFIDGPANKIYRIGLDGKITAFLENAAQANGLAIGPKDELYTVSAQTGRVMSYDATGKGNQVLSGLAGQSVLARPDGSLYVTVAGAKPGDEGTVWLIKNGEKTEVDSGLKIPSGLAYRPDQWLLAVADSASKWVYSYAIAADGTLSAKEPLFTLHVADWDNDAGPESVCYAQEGQLLVGTRSGVQSCADDGWAQAVLPVPDNSRVIGVALGGPEMHTLFAFCGGKIWKRDVKIHAIGAFSPLLPVKSTPL